MKGVIYSSMKDTCEIYYDKEKIVNRIQSKI